MTGLATLLPQGNQKPLVVKDKIWRPDVSLGHASPWNVILFPSVLGHCWLGDSKSIWHPGESWVLVCCWRRFYWSFARLIAPVVTTNSIILNSNKIQNADILIPAYSGCGKWPLNECCVVYTYTAALLSLQMSCRLPPRYALADELRRNLSTSTSSHDQII